MEREPLILPPGMEERWLELAARRRPGYDTYNGWYERVWNGLQTPTFVAEKLSMTVEELEEMAYENKIFSIEDERYRFVPAEQFEHFAGYESGYRQVRYEVSARLAEFWKGLDDLVPHIAQSKWLVWSLLFWKESGICEFTTGGIMRSLVNCKDDEWASVSAGVRERLVSFEHSSRDTSITIIEKFAGVGIR